MSLSTEILAQYIDGNNLVTPSPCPTASGQGSDNGVMYFSEYCIILLKTKQVIDTLAPITQCIDSNGLLHRVPVPTPPGQSNRQEGPDDYLAVLNLCKLIGNTDVPRKFLLAVIKFLGFLNNEAPGTKTLRSFLIRQPQLLAAMVAAAFPSWINPLHIGIRILCFPLFFISAIIIATACINEDIMSTDPRRLSWHLLQTTRKVSLLCWLASKVWLNRLYHDYGPTGMKAVAAIYYNPPGAHPFAKYWVTD